MTYSLIPDIDAEIRDRVQKWCEQKAEAARLARLQAAERRESFDAQPHLRSVVEPPQLISDIPITKADELGASS